MTCWAKLFDEKGSIENKRDIFQQLQAIIAHDSQSLLTFNVGEENKCYLELGGKQFAVPATDDTSPVTDVKSDDLNQITSQKTVNLAVDLEQFRQEARNCKTTTEVNQLFDKVKDRPDADAFQAVLTQEILSCLESQRTANLAVLEQFRQEARNCKTTTEVNQLFDKVKDRPDVFQAVLTQEIFSRLASERGSKPN